MALVGETSTVGPRPRHLTSVGTAVVICGVSVLAAVWIASLLLARADGLATPAYDQAFFQQLVWRVGEDGAWLTSFGDGSFLGLHFSPILVVPALLERGLWLDARLLSLLHAMAVAALAPAGFLFLRAALRPSRHAGLVALGLALPIPAWAVTQQVIRADFHPEVAGVVLALAAGWAALTGRGAATWILAALALSTREDVTYAVFVVGLATWGLAHGRARRRGAALAIVATAWAVIVFGILMPIARDGAIVDTAAYYRWLGSGPGILLTPFRMPDRVIAALTQDRTWFKVAGLLVSLAGLPLLRPRWLLLLAPPLAAVLLSHHPPQALLLLQYPIILVAPALVAAAFGARRALAWLGRHARRPGGQERFAWSAWSAWRDRRWSSPPSRVPCRRSTRARPRRTTGPPQSGPCG